MKFVFYSAVNLVFAICGCSTIEDNGQRFARYNENHVGKSIHGYWATYQSIKSIGGTTSEYYYFDSKSGCEWLLTVENELITGWKYLSAPEMCVLSVGWSGPW